MKMKVLSLIAVFAAVVLAACSGPAEPRSTQSRPIFSQSIATGYSGAICNTPGNDCNRCVSNVVTSFNSISGNFAPAAFHFGTTFAYMTDPSNFYHNEGIVRLPNSGGTYFAVSRLNQGGGTEVSFVNFASRAVFGAERLYGNYTGNNQLYPTNDVAISHATDPNYRHAGGMQALGNVIAVGLEIPNVGAPSLARVRFVDATNPYAVGWGGVDVPRDDPAGNVGYVKLGDGTYLLMVGNTDSRRLDFYQSSTTDILFPGGFTFIRSINVDYPEKWQSTQIVTQCDGQMFIVASGKGGTTGLVRVVRIDPFLGYVVGVAARTFQQSDAYADTDAGAGAYVTPSGKLFYYEIAGDNDIAEANHNNGVCPQNKTQGVAMFEY